jgi:polyisoprenoid-binding protein YceI
MSRAYKLGGLSLLALLFAPTILSAQQRVIPARRYTAPDVAGTHWTVDGTHSEITFRIRHIVGRVRGYFREFTATLVTQGDDWSHGTVNVVVHTPSIETGNNIRDEDLRSERFFDVEHYPIITFESTGIIVEGDSLQMGGLLTIKGHTHPVVLRGEFLGVGKDASGIQRIAFDGITTVDRRDFGLTWNQALDSTTLLSNDVEIELAVEAVRQPEN